MKKWSIFLFVITSFIISCNDGSPSGDDASALPAVPVLSYSITSTQPHDTSYFTQGLEFYNNTLLEGTGLNGKSKLLRLDPKTGKVLQEVKLDDKYFGEGITVLRDTLYQLTYKEHVVHVYSAKDFKKIKEFPLSGEGWGITNDGTHLIVSNGSSDLFYYDPSTFKLIRTQSVTENGNVVPNINELEYVNGFIYANQWQYNYILKIDSNTGEVMAKMDFTPQVEKEKTVNTKANELNGIAYNPATKKFYITGKNWSQIYEVQLDH